MHHSETRLAPPRDPEDYGRWRAAALATELAARSEKILSETESVMRVSGLAAIFQTLVAGFYVAHLGALFPSLTLSTWLQSPTIAFAAQLLAFAGASVIMIVAIRDRRDRLRNEAKWIRLSFERVELQNRFSDRP